MVLFFFFFPWGKICSEMQNLPKSQVHCKREATLVQLKTLPRYGAMVSFSEPIRPTTRQACPCHWSCPQRPSLPVLEHHLNGLITICTHNQSMKQKVLPECKSQGAQATLFSQDLPLSFIKRLIRRPSWRRWQCCLPSFLPASRDCSFSASLRAHFPLLAPSTAMLLSVWLDQSLQKPASSNPRTGFIWPTQYFFVFELALTFKS